MGIVIRLIIGALGVVAFGAPVYAQDMSGWSDKTVCRLVKKQGTNEYIKEAKARNLSCAADKSSKVETTSSDAEWIKTKHPEALCNDGKQAMFSLSKSNSRNWFVYFIGGGVAHSPEAYLSRPKGMKSPPPVGDFGMGYPIIKDFKNKKFNILVIPYCTSDLHQGYQQHTINGKTVYYHGRIIVEDIFSQMDKDFRSANELIFAGFSAGAIGLGFNSDLIARYNNPKVIVDSFWLDKESRKVRDSYTGGPWPQINKFLYGNMPKHCKGHWPACFPQRSKFDSMKIKNVFPIWNLGDPYIKGNMRDVKKSIVSDIKYYDAGFSINAEKLNVTGSQQWGHVLTTNKYYSQEFDGVSVKMLIDNWLMDSGQTKFVKH